MTKNEIMALAEKVGLTSLSLIDVAYLESFAELVAAAEREACAKLCDERADLWPDEGGTPEACASDIRARGKQ